MSLRGWANALRDALHSVTRNPLMAVASMLSVAISLLVLSVVLLLALNLDQMASSVEQQVEIKVYLCTAKDDTPCTKQELPEERKQAIVNQIKQLPDVKETKYVTRHEALEELKKLDPTQREVLSGYEGKENPLSDEVHVKAADVAQVKAVATAVQAIQGVRKVDYGQDFVANLVLFTRAVRIGGSGLVLLLVVATVLTISNTIRLSVYARRREIAIMKLVGATDWYIRRPFMFEGVFLGAMGALIATGITSYGYGRLTLYIQRSVPFLPLAQPADILMNLVLALIGLGAVLGAAGSVVSIRRFLKV